MFFNSFVFLLFLAVVLPVYYGLRGQRSRAVWLLAASYVFYGYWDWRFCSLLLLSTVVDFMVGQALHASGAPRRRKQLLLVSVAVNLGVLGFFKYFNFFADSVVATAASLGLPVSELHLGIILPVGISFYTFQTMSYTIDIYRGRLAPTRSFIDFALFVAFFPQLVAGPIERARNLLPQIAHLGRPRAEHVREGLVLLVLGYLKKVLIGDTAGRIVDQVFGQPDLYRSPELLAALVLFSIQIYADFSGYSNIARGLAKLLGLNLMKNFEQPYLAASITEFWRRWHISLSSWLRDYLYISLGGNRRGRGRTHVNLMLTMLLGGLWHGAAWTFVVWGGLHGLYLAVHKRMLGDRRPADRFVWRGPASLVRWGLSVLATNLLVLLTWLFFRAADFDQAWYFLDSFVHWESSALAGRFLSLTVAFMALTLLLDALEYATGSHVWPLRLRPPVAAGLCTAAMIVVLVLMATTEPLPFVYFQF